MLRAQRIDHLFTLCGGHISPILVAAKWLGIRVADTSHEATAVSAADAVALLTRRVSRPRELVAVLELEFAEREGRDPQMLQRDTSICAERHPVITVTSI